MVFLLKEKELGATTIKCHCKPMLATRWILAKRLRYGGLLDS